jgi:hypothetical protein
MGATIQVLLIIWPTLLATYYHVSERRVVTPPLRTSSKIEMIRLALPAETPGAVARDEFGPANALSFHTSAPPRPQPPLAVRFAADPRQDLSGALQKYGGTLGFGSDSVVRFQFAPPNWLELLPREAVAISHGFYPILIRSVEPNSFVARVRSEIAEEGHAELDAYALFPANFQDLIEAELEPIARAKCGDAPPSQVTVAFSRASTSYLEIVGVVCTKETPMPTAGQLP